MKIPHGNSESESRGWAAGKEGIVKLTLHGGTGVCLAGNIVVVRPWQDARRLGFAAQKTEISAPTTSLLPHPPASWLPKYYRYGKYLPVALLPGLQDTEGVETAISGHTKIQSALNLLILQALRCEPLPSTDSFL